jgi:NAD dependent epimerase/dehydratase family enzyme
MKKVLITGGSGLVGTAISEQLILKGYDVVFLSRKKAALTEKNIFHWNVVENTIDKAAVIDVDHIIHLAGENVAAKKWSTRQKDKILKSRVNSSRLLLEAINAAHKGTENNIESIISASGVGYYGTAPSEQSFSEDDQPGRDFLSTVSVKWENEINK